MGRGKGIRRAVCWCTSCKRDFRSCREDAVTCSAKCRKARNRLLGGADGTREPAGGVTDKPSVFRVLRNGQHVGSYPTREAAELAIDGWRREWDGVFSIRVRRLKT